MKRIIRFLFSEYLYRVALEFVWLICSVAFGMGLIGAVEQIPHERFREISQAYGTWLIWVLWLAAMLRYAVAYALDWADAYLDRVNAQKQQDLQLVKSGFMIALRMIFKPQRQQPQQQDGQDES
jgi:hypothetical protein